MNVFEYSKCVECGKEYRGKFYVDNNGSIKCYDCDRPEEFENIRMEKVKVTDERLLKEIVRDLLIKDVKRIYATKSAGANQQLDFMRKEDGTLDVNKLYFQGNDIELVLLANKKAYTCLEYIEAGHKRHETFADKIVKKYKGLREYKLSKKREKNFLEELNSDKMVEIENEVSIL